MDSSRKQERMRLQLDRDECKIKRLALKAKENLRAVVAQNKDASVEKGQITEKYFAFSKG